MCWTAINPSFMRECRASEDIKVYKILLVRKSIFGKIEFISPCMDFHYKPGKVYHSELGITQTNYSLIIEEGLHCFQNMTSAGIYADNLFIGLEPYAIVPAIIPKGTRYYINENREIVTEKLKIVL